MTEIPAPVDSNLSHWAIAVVLSLLGLLQSAYYFIYKNHTEEDAQTRVLLSKTMETNNAILLSLTTLRVSVEQQHMYQTGMLASVSSEVVSMRKTNGDMAVAFGKLETRLDERWNEESAR